MGILTFLSREYSHVSPMLKFHQMDSEDFRIKFKLLGLPHKHPNVLGPLHILSLPHLFRWHPCS